MIDQATINSTINDYANIKIHKLNSPFFQITYNLQTTFLSNEIFNLTGIDIWGNYFDFDEITISAPNTVYSLCHKVQHVLLNIKKYTKPCENSNDDTHHHS